MSNAATKKAKFGCACPAHEYTGTAYGCNHCKVLRLEFELKSAWVQVRDLEDKLNTREWAIQQLILRCEGGPMLDGLRVWKYLNETEKRPLEVHRVATEILDGEVGE